MSRDKTYLSMNIYFFYDYFLNDISNYRIQIVLKKHYMNWISSWQSSYHFHPRSYEEERDTYLYLLLTDGAFHISYILIPLRLRKSCQTFILFLFYDMFESASQVRLVSSSFWDAFVPPDTQKICSCSLPAWTSSNLHVLRILWYQFKSIHYFVYMEVLLIPNR